MDARFKKYDDVLQFIKEYEERNYIQTMIAHSRTIEGARRRGYKAFVSPELKYTEILYRCIHSGSRKSRSKGHRPNQTTYKQQCPFFIRLKADGDELFIADKNEEHNHLHNKETHAFLPRQRILDPATKDYVKKVLQLRPNKKLLQVELQKTTNKRVLLRDLHNLGNSSQSDDSLQATLDYLSDREDAVVELLKNNDNILLSIFYQDKEMQRLFNCYPEMLFVDAIHKVSDRRMPLYILLVQNGNGESEIVGFYLVTNEEEETMKHLPVFLKKHNNAWENIQCIMTDKDFVERDVFRNAFPQAHLLICLFHTLRTFRREITPDKMGIAPGEKDLCLQILQDIAYSKNESEYEANFIRLQDTGITSVINYYVKNWHNIRSEWVVGLIESQFLTFGNRTNNRLESINSKVTQVVERHSKILELFQNLDKLMISLRTERNYRASNVILKVPFLNNDICDAQKKYMYHLTPYSYGLVSEQFLLKEKVIVKNGIIYSKEGPLLNVDKDSCSCSFFKCMALPCRHILKFREMNGLEIFSKTLYSNRWSKTYYSNNSRIIDNVSTEESTNSEITISESKTTSKRILSQFEKFNVISKKTTKLASLASEAPSRFFAQRLEVLNFIIKMWENGREVSVTAVEDEVDISRNSNMPSSTATIASSSSIPASLEEDSNLQSVQSDNLAIQTPTFPQSPVCTSFSSTGPLSQTCSLTPAAASDFRSLSSVCPPSSTASLQNCNPLVPACLEEDSNLQIVLSDDNLATQTQICNLTPAPSGDLPLLSSVCSQFSTASLQNCNPLVPACLEEDSNLQTVLSDDNLATQTQTSSPLPVCASSSSPSGSLSQTCNLTPVSACLEDLNLPSDDNLTLQASTSPQSFVCISSSTYSLSQTCSPSPTAPSDFPVLSTVCPPPSSASFQNSNLTSFLPVLPPKIKKRGRPKGSNLTVIGLPTKKKCTKRIVSFERKHPRIKDSIMLQWFVSKEDSRRALSGEIIDDVSIKQNSNLISSACLDEKASVLSLRKYFTDSAWFKIKQLIDIKKKNPLWLCSCCIKDCEENSICCDSCLEWCHIKCANLQTAPKSRHWFCRSCHDKNDVLV